MTAPAPPSMLHRIQIVGWATIAVAHLVILIVSIPALTSYADATASWWSWTGLAVAVTCSASALLGAIRGRAAPMERLGLLCVVAYTVLLAAWFVGWNGDGVEAKLGGPSLPVWILLLPQIGGSILVVCGQLRAAVVGMVSTGVLSTAVVVTAASDGRWVPMSIAAWTFGLAGLFQVMAWSLVVGAQRLDRERALAARDAVSRLRSSAHDSEQRRVDAMVHDRLIAVLLAARPGPVDEGVAATAEAVLTELEQLAAGPRTGAAWISSDEVAERIVRSIDDLGDGVEVTVNDRAGMYRYPAPVVDTVVDALGESIRNVHRHAGRDWSCAVLCRLRPEQITVNVVDDGVGFDVDDVPANRIGVALGITERMRQLDGGSSRVASIPGTGTRVELTWRQDAEVPAR
ncbi:ATP-binding protein [Gordonia shandongensis]|uniref:ATP-binding protein n=1 Tax=Gordonia shandongensis TaxID=376351 RepID=UPI0003FCC867|nr:ATP-binding protein [Gordonia shandongensis]